MKKIMKVAIITALAATFIIPTAAEAKSSKKYTNPSHGATHKVSGYTKKNGTHVDSYQRTRANHTKRDNLRYHP